MWGDRDQGEGQTPHVCNDTVTRAANPFRSATAAALALRDPRPVAPRSRTPAGRAQGTRASSARDSGSSSRAAPSQAGRTAERGRPGTQRTGRGRHPAAPAGGSSGVELAPAHEEDGQRRLRTVTGANEGPRSPAARGSARSPPRARTAEKGCGRLDARAPEPSSQPFPSPHSHRGPTAAGLSPKSLLTGLEEPLCGWGRPLRPP